MSGSEIWRAFSEAALDLATSAESGFGEDIDVSTTEGAISAVPDRIFVSDVCAFPVGDDQLSTGDHTARSAVMVGHDAAVGGRALVCTIRQRLRSSIPVLVFSLMLTLAYSIFQGNVGTAYRQRTQIQVFLFIFIAVGLTLFLERREDVPSGIGPKGVSASRMACEHGSRLKKECAELSDTLMQRLPGSTLRSWKG